MAILPLIRIVRPPPAAIAVIVVLTLLLFSNARAAESCAQLVTAEGTVEVRRSGSGQWISLERLDQACTGDSLRVLAFSRATLKLADDTLLRLDANTAFTFAESDDEPGSLLEVIRGLIHVISRDPRSLRFSTPYANAGLEGTEFLIAAADDETSVTVLEGEVMMSNASGRVSIQDGEQGTARATASPVSAPYAEGIELIRWTSHFAPLLDAPLPPADREPSAREANNADFFAGRAAQRLNRGRIAEAEADLNIAMRLAPRHDTAHSLQAVIAVERRDLDEAFELAQAAVRNAPSAAVARLARAYVYQARGEYAEALQDVQAAVATDGTSATAWARLAELRLVAGDYADSAAAARRALALNGSLGYAHSMLGFAELQAMRSTWALSAFQMAVELDPVSPLPRLGLALALIQSNQVERGREELETAVILDPTDSLVRSYMAKVYHTERRGELSGSQLTLAKQLDPDDPTPWLYDALRKSSENRPAEALRDLERAYELNEWRATYRSRLQVDEDLATRSAGFGRLHRELGFEALALKRGWESVAAQPGDYAGHRLLADVYSTLPRHEIARVSELYQSQLLQPINLTPVPPQLGEVGQFIAQTVGPGEPAFGDLYSLVNRNGARIQGSAVIAGQGTQGESLAISGLYDRLSYGAGHFRFRTDGFRRNNDLDQTVSNAFLHYRPNGRTSILAEMRSSDTEKGDLQWLFDRNAFDELLRQREDMDTFRAGVRMTDVAGGTLLGSISYTKGDSVTTLGPSFSLDTAFSTYSADVQHLATYAKWSFRSGLTLLDVDAEQLALASVPSFPPLSAASVQGREVAIYTYATSELVPGLNVTLGASADHVQGQGIAQDKLDPKIGLIWSITDRTQLRAAAFETIQGPLISRHDVHPRLEPVDVAGFNQFFFGTEGETAVRYGVGIDHVFSDSLYGGLEASRRTTDFAAKVVVPPVGETLIPVNTSEELHRAYLYWTPTDAMALSAEYQHEHFDNDGALFNGYTEMRAQRLPLQARYFHPSGFNAGLRGTYVRQSGHFSRFMELQPEPLVEPEYGKDAFWIFDASLGYRLPNRRGVLSLNVANLFDEEFRFQDTDPQNSEFLPERMLYLRFTLAFD